MVSLCFVLGVLASLRVTAVRQSPTALRMELGLKRVYHHYQSLKSRIMAAIRQDHARIGKEVTLILMVEATWGS